MTISPQLREKIERISNLPTLPQVAARLLRVVNDPETGAADVASLVSQDVSLSAKIVRLANSAYYGTPRAIASIQTAVVRLGFKVINTMVLSLTVFDMFPADSHSIRFDRKAFWRHCVRCGLMAKLLAQRARRCTVDPEEAFCAGLLHDVGKVVMEQYLHEDFAAALDYAQRKAVSFWQAEDMVLQYTHTDVAAWLTSRWELPDALFEPLTAHHSPGEAHECREIAYLCHYADHLCYTPGAAEPDDGVAPPLCERTHDVTGLSENDVAAASAQFADDVHTMDFFFEILDGR